MRIVFLEFWTNESKHSSGLMAIICSSTPCFFYPNEIFVHSLSGGNPVFPVALSGWSLKIPTSLWDECLNCVWWVRRLAGVELRGGFPWISWFSSWFNIDIWLQVSQSCFFGVLSLFGLFPPSHQAKLRRWGRLLPQSNALRELRRCLQRCWIF